MHNGGYRGGQDGGGFFGGGNFSGGAGWVAKPWGRTRELAPDVHEIEVVKGGFCSAHKHEFKANDFTILSGDLTVLVSDQPEPLTLTGPGVINVVLLSRENPHGLHGLTIPAGVWHQFIARTAVRAVEIYTAAPPNVVDANDIVRANQGGVQ